MLFHDDKWDVSFDRSVNDDARSIYIFPGDRRAMMAVHVTPAPVCFGLLVSVLNSFALFGCHSLPDQLFHGNGSATRESKSEYLSQGITTESNVWNQTHDSKRHNSLSATSAILVTVVSIGFMLTALYLLWRRYHFSNSNATCHYTTLNQEFTLSANDIPDSADDVDFQLDLSDTPSSDDDDELLQWNNKN